MKCCLTLFYGCILYNMYSYHRYEYHKHKKQMTWFYLSLSLYILSNLSFIMIYDSTFKQYQDGSFNTFYYLCTELIKDPQVKKQFFLAQFFLLIVSSQLMGLFLMWSIVKLKSSEDIL